MATIISQGTMGGLPAPFYLAQLMRDKLVNDSSHRNALAVAPIRNVPTVKGSYPVADTSLVLNLSTGDSVSPIEFGAPLTAQTMTYKSRDYSIKEWDHGQFKIPRALQISSDSAGLDVEGELVNAFTSNFYNQHAYHVYAKLNDANSYNGNDANYIYDPGNITTTSSGIPSWLQVVKQRFVRARLGAPDVIIMAGDVFGYFLQNDYARNFVTTQRFDAVEAGQGAIESFMQRFFDNPGLRMHVENDAYVAANGTETALFTGKIGFYKAAGGGSTASFLNTCALQNSSADLFTVESKYEESMSSQMYYCRSNWDVVTATPTAGVLWTGLLS